MGKITLIVLGFIILSFVLRYNSLKKTVEKLNKILYLDRNPEEYIKECDKLLDEIQGKRDKNLNLLQKSTGLFYAGRFDEVQRTLYTDMKQIPPNGQHLYYQNLVLSLIFGGQPEEGHRELEEAREVLNAYKKTEGNSKGIEFIFAVDDLYQGKYSERKEFFEDLSVNGRNYYRQAMANYCLALIYKHEGNLEKMNEHFALAKDLGLNSFVEKLVDREYQMQESTKNYEEKRAQLNVEKAKTVVAEDEEKIVETENTETDSLETEEIAETEV